MAGNQHATQSGVTQDQPIEDYDFSRPSNQDEGKQHDTSAIRLINETSNHGSPVFVESPEMPNPSEEQHSSTLEHEPTNGMDHTDLCEEEDSMMPSQLVSGLSLNKPVSSETGSALIVCGYGSWIIQKNVIEKSINVSVPSHDQLSSPRPEHESQPGTSLPCTEGSMTSGKLPVECLQDSSLNDKTGSTLFVCGSGSWKRPTMTDGPEAVVVYYETERSTDETTLLPTLRPFTSPSDGHELQMN